ncbi:MAG: hypothetical protein JWL63_3315 [Rhodocyclales bacterium]|nr:hypothetical protein [Rhodocyclales bacterium]
MLLRNFFVIFGRCGAQWFTAAMLLFCAVVDCSAQPSTASVAWKTDCVGRMQLSLPPDIEVAADTTKSWHKQSSPRVGRFTDDEVAGWSSYFVLGEIQISHAWTASEISAFMDESKRSMDKFRPGGTVQKMVGSKPFGELSTSPQKGFAWDFGTTRYAILQVGNHVLGWTAGRPNGEPVARLANNYNLIVRGLSARDTFSLPKEVGVCLPYVLFVTMVKRHVTLRQHTVFAGIQTLRFG